MVQTVYMEMMNFSVCFVTQNVHQTALAFLIVFAVLQESFLFRLIFPI